MSLNGARLRYVDESGQEVLVPAKGRTFQIGSYFSCDLILEPQAERLICEIKCDAFGRVTIHNQSNKETTIHLNDKIIHGQRGHPLLPGNRITILDRVYTWECHKISGSEDVPSTPERLSPVEQAPNSCPSLKSHRPQIDKRLTVHNFRYSINSDDEGNTSIESRDQNESHLEEEESLNISAPPSTEMLSCETPKVDLVEATQNKENTATPPASHQQLLQLCALSDVVITSFSPRETGVKVEKSFTCVRKPTKMGKQTATSVTMSTPKSVYSTPKGGVLSELNDDSCSRDLVDFSTPSTSKKTKRGSSMYLIDLTTPSKLRPSLKQQLPTPISVDSTDESSDGSPFVIDITKSDTPPTPSRSRLAKTPRRPVGGAAATPNRTPQSLMKRALLTSTKKKQIAAHQTDITPVATPKRPNLQEARRLCRTSPRLPFPSLSTPEHVAEQRAVDRKRGQTPKTSPRKRQSLNLGTPRDNKLSQIRKSLAAAKRSPTVDLGNRLKAKARRTLNSPKLESPKSESPKSESPKPASLPKCSTPEKLDDSSTTDDLSRTFTVMNESGDPAEEGSVLGMMAALVTGEMDSSVASKILDASLPTTEIKEHSLAEKQPSESLETELLSAVEEVKCPNKDDGKLDENATKSLKEAVKEQDHPLDKEYHLDPKENPEYSSISVNENVVGGNVIIEDSICEEVHANIPKPLDDDNAKEGPSDIKPSDSVALAEENIEPNSRVETSIIRRSLRRLSVDQRAGAATTPRRSSKRRASVEASSSSKAEESKMGTRRASCSALVDNPEAGGTPRRRRRFTEEMGTPTRQSKRLLVNTPKRALQVDDSIGDMGVIVEEAAGQEDDDEPRAIVEDENYGKELPCDEPDNVNYQGLRDLLKTPKNCSTPRFKGLREMMRTPKVAASPIFGNIEELLDNSIMGSTPHRNKTSRNITVARVAVEDGKALDGVLKTPSARNIMVPIEPASAVLKSRGDSLATTTEYDLDMTNTTLHLDQIFDDVPSTSMSNMETTEVEINVTSLSTASALDPLKESVSSEVPMSVCKPAAADLAFHKNDPLTSTTYKAAMQADLNLSTTFTEEAEATSRPSTPNSNEMSGIQLLDQTSDSMFSEPLMVSGVESCEDVTVDETGALGQTTCPPIEINEIDTDSNVGLTEPLVFSDDDEAEVVGDAGRTPKKSRAYKLDEPSTSRVITPLSSKEISVLDENKTRESDSLIQEVSLIEVNESVPEDSINATNDGKSLVIELDSSSDTEAAPAKENNESTTVELTIVESETFPLDSTEDSTALVEELSTSVDEKPVESGSPISEDAKIAAEVQTDPSDPQIIETLSSIEEEAEKSSTAYVASTDNGKENDISASVDLPLDSTADSIIIVEEELSSNVDQKPIDTKEDSAGKTTEDHNLAIDALPSQELPEEKPTEDDTAMDSETIPLDSTVDSPKPIEAELAITEEDSAGKPAEDHPVVAVEPSEELTKEKTIRDDGNDVSAAVNSDVFPLDSATESSIIVEEELSLNVNQKPIDSESPINKDASAIKPEEEDQPVIDALPSEELAEEKTSEDDGKEKDVSAAMDLETFPLDSTADSAGTVEEELSSKVDQEPIDTKEDSAGKPAEEDHPVVAIEPSEELTKEKTIRDDGNDVSAAVESDVFALDSTAESSTIVEEELSLNVNQKPTDSECPITKDGSATKPEEEDHPVIDGLPSQELAEEKTIDEVVASTDKLPVDATTSDAVTDNTAVESLGQDVEPNQIESVSIITKPEVDDVSIIFEEPLAETEEPKKTNVENDNSAAELLGLDTQAEPSTSEVSLVEAEKPENGDDKNDDTAEEPLCLDDTPIQNESDATVPNPKGEVSVPLDAKSEIEPSTSEVSLVEAEEEENGDDKNDDTAEEQLCLDDTPIQNESVATVTNPEVEVSVPLDPKSEIEPSTSEVTSVEADKAENVDMENADSSKESKEAEQITLEVSLVDANCATATPDGIVSEKPTPNIQDVEVVSPSETPAQKANASASPSSATIEGDVISLETSPVQDLPNSDTVPIDQDQEVPQVSSTTLIEENKIIENVTETEIMPDKKPCEDEQTNGEEAQILVPEETSKLKKADNIQEKSVCEAESEKKETTIDQLPMDESAPFTAAEKSSLKELGSPDESNTTDITAGDELKRDLPALEDSVVTVILDDDSTSTETTQNESSGQVPASPKVIPPTDDKAGEQTPVHTYSIIEESLTEQPNKDFIDESADEVIQLDASSIVEEDAEHSVIEEMLRAKSTVNNPEVVAITEDLTAQEDELKPTEESSALLESSNPAKESLEEETGQNNPPEESTEEVSLAHNLDTTQDIVTEQLGEVTTEEVSQGETDMLESSPTAVQDIRVAENPEISITEAPISSKAVEIEEATASSKNQTEILSAHESSRVAESADEKPANDESTSTAAESEDKSQDQTATEEQQSEKSAQVIPIASPKTKVVATDELEPATEAEQLSVEEEAKDTPKLEVTTEELTEDTAALASESNTNLGEEPQPDDPQMEAAPPAQKVMQTSAVEDADVIELSDDSDSESPPVKGTPVEEDRNPATEPASEASVPIAGTLSTEEPKEEKVEDVPQNDSVKLQKVESAAAPVINQEDQAERPQTSEKLAFVETEAVEPTSITEPVTDVEQAERVPSKSVAEVSGDEESPAQEKDVQLHTASNSEGTQNEKLAAPKVDSSESEKSEILKKSPKHSTMKASRSARNPLPHEDEPSDKDKKETKPVKRATRKGSASTAEDVVEKPSRRARESSVDVEENKSDDIHEKPKRRAAVRKPSSEVAEPIQETKKADVLIVIPEEEPHTSRPNQDNELQKDADTYQKPQEEVLDGRKPSEEVKPKATVKSKRQARKPSADVAEPMVPIQKEKETDKESKKEETHSSKINTDSELQMAAETLQKPEEEVLEKPLGSRRAQKPSEEAKPETTEKSKKRARKPSASAAEPMVPIRKEKETDEESKEEETHSSKISTDTELQKEIGTHQKPEEEVLDARKPSEEVKPEATVKSKRQARKPSADVAEPMVPIQNEKESKEVETHSSKINTESELQMAAETLQKQEEDVLQRPKRRGRPPSTEVKDEGPKTITEKEKRRGHKHPEEHIQEETEITEEPKQNELQKQDDAEKEGELKKSDETKQEKIIKSHTERPKRRGRKASAEETESTSGKKPKIDELIPEEASPKSNQDDNPPESKQPEKPKRRGLKASSEEDANKKPSSDEVLQSIGEGDNESKAISTVTTESEVVRPEGRSKRRGRKPSKEEVVVEGPPASQTTDSANGNSEKPLSSVPEDQTTNLTELNGPQKRFRISSEFVPAAVEESAKEAEPIERPRRRAPKTSVDIEHAVQDVPEKSRRRGRTPAADNEKHALGEAKEEEPDKKTRRTARKTPADTVDSEVEHPKDTEEVAEPDTEPNAAMATSQQLPEEEEEPKTRRRGRRAVSVKKDTPEEGPSRRRGHKATEDEAPKSEGTVKAKSSLEKEQPNEVPADSNNDVQELPVDVEAVPQVAATQKKTTRRVRKASANVDEGTTAVSKKATARRGRKEDTLDDDDVQEKQIDLQQVPTESVPAVVVMSGITAQMADGVLGTSENELTPRRREGRNMPRKNYDETSDEDKQSSARRARKPAVSKLLAFKAPEEEGTPQSKRAPVEEVDTPANTVPAPEPTTSQRREGRNVPRKNYTEAPDEDKPSTSRSRRVRNLTAKALELIVDSSPRPNTPKGRKAKAAGEDESVAKKALPEEAAPPPPTQAESGAEEEPAPAIAKGRGVRRKAEDDLAESGTAPPTKRGARGQHEELEEQAEAKPAKKNVRAAPRKTKVETETEEPVPAKKARGGSRAKTPVKPSEEKPATELEEHSPTPIRKGRGGTRAKTPVVVIPENSEPEDELTKKPAARSRARGAKAAAVPEPEQPAQDSDAEAASSSSTTASRGGRAKKVHFEPMQTATTVEASAEDAPKRATRSRRK